MNRARLRLSRLSVDSKISQGAAIKSAMSGNPRFTDPTISMAMYGGIIDDLSSKQVAYNLLLGQLNAALHERDLAEVAYDSATTRLAAYVESVTAGDAIGIMSAGMDVRNPSLPVGTLEQICNVRVEAGGNAGVLRVRWQRLRGAQAYEVQIAESYDADEQGWRSVKPSCNTRACLTGLTSGVKIWVRVRGIGKRGPGQWSDPAVKTVP
jgi:hypothetical protein